MIEATDTDPRDPDTITQARTLLATIDTVNAVSPTLANKIVDDLCAQGATDVVLVMADLVEADAYAAQARGLLATIDSAKVASPTLADKLVDDLCSNWEVQVLLALVDQVDPDVFITQEMLSSLSRLLAPDHNRALRPEVVRCVFAWGHAARRRYPTALHFLISRLRPISLTLWSATSATAASYQLFFQQVKNSGIDPYAPYRLPQPERGGRIIGSSPVARWLNREEKEQSRLDRSIRLCGDDIPVASGLIRSIFGGMPLNRVEHWEPEETNGSKPVAKFTTNVIEGIALDWTPDLAANRRLRTWLALVDETDPRLPGCLTLAIVYIMSRHGVQNPYTLRAICLLIAAGADLQTHISMLTSRDLGGLTLIYQLSALTQPLDEDNLDVPGTAPAHPLNVVRALVSAYPEVVNSVALQGRTLLWNAIENANLPMIDLLLHAGASTSSLTPSGNPIAQECELLLSKPLSEKTDAQAADEPAAGHAAYAMVSAFVARRAITERLSHPHKTPT